MGKGDKTCSVIGQPSSSIQQEEGHVIGMLSSRTTLQRILGVLWLIDGLLQLQPQMFSMNMVNGVMKPMLDGQPGTIESSLQYIVNQTTSHLVLVNLIIVVVQIGLGLAFLLLPNRWMKPVVLISIIWALIVWYGGEGMSMLLTGQASILTGAPGAVLLYPLLGLAIWPRQDQQTEEGLLSRKVLLYVFAGFWIFSALLQLQPYWWQSGQISQTISSMVGQGGLNGVLIDPVLQHIANTTANSEIALNIVLIVVCLALGLGLAFGKQERLRLWLIASLVLSVIVWYIAQGFGMIFTGMATDFNSGLLLVVIATACWPQSPTASHAVSRTRFMRETRQAMREPDANATPIG